jgi:NADH-quinone oxidoreductase subunit H
MQEFLQSELWLDYVWPTLLVAGKILLLVVPLLIAVAMATYTERKVLGAIQLRKGPNVVGPFGLLQPFADGLKLFFKETIIPTKANKVMFILAPMITFALALLGWAVMPISGEWVIANLNVGILYLFAVSSLGVYGIIISGWASNSKYAFLGAIRSSAQMVSYEVSIGLVIITVLLCVGSLNLGDIVRAQAGGITHWYAVSGLFPMFVVFFISGLAETNRIPFDLPEAEGELVAGYNVEYSSMSFAMFFLGEYANMLLMSAMTVTLFLGGWYSPFNLDILNAIPGGIWFALKVFFLLVVMIWVRGTYPRYRYDQLMRLGWKVFLPLSLLWVVGTSGYLVYTNTVPNLEPPASLGAPATAPDAAPTEEDSE